MLAEQDACASDIPGSAWAPSAVSFPLSAPASGGRWLEERQEFGRRLVGEFFGEVMATVESTPLDIVGPLTPKADHIEPVLQRPAGVAAP